MTGTFSTVVNFSLLGMLQRLHKLYIQEECQSKTGSASGICFPRQEKYGRKKDGNKQYEKFSIDISNQEIYEAMKEAETRAKDSMETLCMAEDLKQQKLWDIPPIPTHLVPHNDENDSAENEEETEEEKGDDFQDPFIYPTESISDLSNDVSQLYNSKAVDVSVKMKVENMKKRKGKKIPFKKLECQGDGSIPMYKQSTSEPSNQKSPFVELEIPGQEKVMIRKRTAVGCFKTLRLRDFQQTISSVSILMT